MDHCRGYTIRGPYNALDVGIMVISRIIVNLMLTEVNVALDVGSKDIMREIVEMQLNVLYVQT